MTAEKEARSRSTPISIALLNDFDIVVNGLAEMLAPYDDVEVIDTCVGDVHLDRYVEVALFDTYGRHGMPWIDLDNVVGNTRADYVAVFTFSFSDEVVAEALAHGVSGYLWKGSTSDHLVASLRRIAMGETVVDSAPHSRPASFDGYRWPFDSAGLSARESEVLALMAEGLSNPAIAEALYISRETVKSHVKHVLKKLGVSSRLEAATLAVADKSFARQLRTLSRRNDEADRHQLVS